jgi:hypothetical protein
MLYVLEPFLPPTALSIGLIEFTSLMLQAHAPTY